jgi:signal transduction histidine kinase
MAVVEVSDTGFGIPDDSLPDLFREFYRVKSDHTRDIPGTGLGLAICKRLVTDLGGTIEVHSRMNEGTTFVVRLPVSAKAAPRDVRAR